MKSNLLILLQARCSSKRLPNKVLKKINGIPMIVLCANRLSNTGRKVIVLTSNHKSDDKLVRVLVKKKIKFFRGSLNNVLLRYQQVAKTLNEKDLIVRATGDNTVPDGYLVETLFNRIKKIKKSYLRFDSKIHNLPKGITLEIFNAKKILSLKKNLNKKDKEHVTLKIYKKNKKKYLNIFNELKSNIDLTNYSLSIDNLEDYKFVKKIFKNFKNPIKVRLKQILNEITL